MPLSIGVTERSKEKEEQPPGGPLQAEHQPIDGGEVEGDEVEGDVAEEYHVGHHQLGVPANEVVKEEHIGEDDADRRNGGDDEQNRSSVGGFDLEDDLIEGAVVGEQAAEAGDLAGLFAALRPSGKHPLDNGFRLEQEALVNSGGDGQHHKVAAVEVDALQGAQVEVVEVKQVNGQLKGKGVKVVAPV